MFNRIITFLIFMLMVLAIMAQQPVTGDSIAAQALDEIVVSAPKVIRKADMDVFYPSRTAVKNSKDGMQLLRNLMIPTVTVNEVLGSVTSSSQEVQVRINGRVATVQQLQSLLPETIKRVEWIENPGLRYGNAYAVLNFVVVNPTLGGSLMTKGMPSLNCAWGDYSGSLKLNSGRSQWGATGDFKLTNKIGSYREYHETFTKPDGESVTRTETPLGGYNSDKWEFTAGVLCPFNKYDRGSISLNRYNRNETHYRVNFAPMPFLQVRYDIQWGRQKKEAKKLVNADADIDQSSAKGR